MTLSNLLGQHAHTTHDYCSRGIWDCIQELNKKEGNTKTGGGEYRKRWKIGVSNKRPKKKVWKENEECALLKHAHIKYKGRRKWPRNVRGQYSDRQVEPAYCVF